MILEVIIADMSAKILEIILKQKLTTTKGQNFLIKSAPRILGIKPH